MEPFHEQKTQELAPSGAIADVENPREAAPHPPAIDLDKIFQELEDKIFRKLNTENDHDLKEIHRAFRIVKEQYPRFTERFKQVLTMTVELQSLVMALCSKHSKDNDFNTLAEKMGSRLAQYNAQFQEFMQWFANLKAAAAALGPIAPYFSPEIETFAGHISSLIEPRTILIEAARAQLARVVVPPTSVCHSESGSYTDSSFYDSSYDSSSSDVPAPACPRAPDVFSDSPDQNRSNVHSERAVSPECASLQLQVHVGTQRPPHPHPFLTCSPSGIISAVRRSSLASMCAQTIR